MGQGQDPPVLRDAAHALADGMTCNCLLCEMLSKVKSKGPSLGLYLLVSEMPGGEGGRRWGGQAGSEAGKPSFRMDRLQQA